MSNYYVVTRSPDYLEHHGILGMKWGVRRYQNKDGSLTPEGRARYGDVLTKKQMQGYIKDYNLRTGSNKTINKNTVFKTANGLYDYKGRKINTDVTVEDPMNKVEMKTETKPKTISQMTDEELRAANQRMQAEEDYKRHLANAMPPKKVTVMQSFMGNLKNTLVKNIPEGIGNGLKDAVANAIKESFKPEEKKEEPKKTDLYANPATLNDQQLADLTKRWENTLKVQNAQITWNNNNVKVGEAILKDYWVDDPENNRSYKLVERDESDSQGMPIDQKYYRQWLEDKNRR